MSRRIRALILILFTTIPLESYTINLYITTPRKTTYQTQVIDSDTITLPDPEIDTTIVGKAILTIKDSADSIIYQDTAYINQGEVTITIPPEYAVKEARGIATKGVIQIRGNIIYNGTNSAIKGIIYNQAGIKEREIEIKPGGTPIPYLPGGIHILHIPIARKTYKIITINSTKSPQKTIAAATTTQQRPKALFIKQVAGERNPNIEITIQTQDTNNHTTKIYPYYKEEQLKNKELLITLIPKKIQAKNINNTDTTITITRRNLTDKYNDIDYTTQQNMTYIESWTTNHPPTTLYFQNWPEEQKQRAIQDIQNINTYTDSIIKLNNLTSNTSPLLTQPLTIKDTTGIDNEGHVPPYTIVIEYTETNIGTRAWSYNEASTKGYIYVYTGIATTSIGPFPGEFLGTLWNAHDCSDRTSIFYPANMNTLPSINDILEKIIHQQQADICYNTEITNYTQQIYYPDKPNLEYYITLYAIEDTTTKAIQR